MATIPGLSSGAAIQDADLFASRQGADTSDVKVTGTQLKTYIATSGYITASSTDTLTNKTFDADGAGNSITNIENADIKAGAGIALNKLAALTADRAMVTDGSGFASASAVTATELGYVSGVTSAIQTQLNAKQALDATLTALAAYNTNGLITQTAADTFTGRTITGTVNRLSVSDGDGVAGNPTIDISASYVGQASITTLGTIGTGTWQGTAIANAYIASGLDAVKIGAGSVDNTEFSYLNGVTSAIQTQLNAKIGGSSGATDNAIIRADGTGGATIQTSLASVDDSGNIAVPSAASIGLGAGKGRFIFTDASTDLVELSTANMSIGTTASSSYKLLVSDARTVTTTSYSVARIQNTPTYNTSSGASNVKNYELQTTAGGTITGGNPFLSGLAATLTNNFSVNAGIIATHETRGLNFIINGTQTVGTNAFVSQRGLYADLLTVTTASSASSYVDHYGITAWVRSALGTTAVTSKSGIVVILENSADVNYGIYVQSTKGATTNYGIFMAETSTAAKHLLAKDSQKTYFGTGEDAAIQYTGTVWDFDVELATSEIVFNNSGIDTDFRVETDTATHHFFLDSTNVRAGFNTSAPDRAVEINDASGNCLRLTYNDANGGAANYSDFLVSSGGDLTITPSGGDTTVTGTCTVSSTAIMGATLRLKGYTVATLPAGAQGDRAYATDLLTPTYGATAVGGGAVVLPVFYDGTNWVCA